MSEIAMLRLLINERLTAAAEEIFCAFGRAMCELEERLSAKSLELERQRRLLELSVKPQVKMETQHPDLLRLEESSLAVACLEPSELPEELQLVKEEPQEMWSAEERGEGAMDDNDHVIKMTLVQSTSATDEHLEGPTVGPQPPPPLTVHQHDETPNGLDCEPGTSTPSTRTDATSLPSHGPVTTASPHVARSCRASSRFSSGLPANNNNNNPPYVCSVCGKAFGQRMYWAAHVRLHRSGGLRRGASGGGGGDSNKSFRCDICGKWLTRLDGLEKHLRVHTGEKPYGCHQCGKRFSDNSNYKRHIRRHGPGGALGGDDTSSLDMLGVLQDSGSQTF